MKKENSIQVEIRFRPPVRKIFLGIRLILFLVIEGSKQIAGLNHICHHAHVLVITITLFQVSTKHTLNNSTKRNLTCYHLLKTPCALLISTSACLCSLRPKQFFVILPYLAD